MKKVTFALITLIMFAFVVVTFTIFSFNTHGASTGKQVQNNTTVNESMELMTISNTTNKTLSVPSSDIVENSIDWSKYPHIGYHFLKENRIAGPNTIINHTFLLVSFMIEIKTPDDVSDIYKEMSSIIKMERTILGDNSDPELIGEVDGAAVFFAGMLPDSTEIYREDYYHPVNNMTWSDIDASEIE